jgi:hypothetical protein
VSSAGATIFGVAPALVFRAGAGPAEVAPGRTLLDSPP